MKTQDHSTKTYGYTGFWSMCNITTIATSFWFHLFSKPIHFGQFFGTSFLASFHPTQDLGTELVGQARGLLKKGKRATKLRPSARAVYRSLGLVGRQSCVEGMQKSTVFFFGRVEGGGGSMFLYFFFGYESSFFF